MKSLIRCGRTSMGSICWNWLDSMRRNHFLLLLLALAFASCSGPDVLNLFVGTYSDGFYAYDFDQGAGHFVGEGPVAKAEMPNPSYLTVHANKVYAVSEMPDTRASVWAWRWGGSGFELINSQPTGLPEHGEDPCYVSTNGTFLAVANYSGGTLATYRLREDGSIAPLDSLLVSGIGGPDLSRQESPHVHCALFSPDGKHLFFSEFSADEIGRLDVYAGGVRKSDVWTSMPGECGTIAAPLPCIPTTVPGTCCSMPPASTCT